MHREVGKLVRERKVFFSRRKKRRESLSVDRKSVDTLEVEPLIHITEGGGGGESNQGVMKVEYIRYVMLLEEWERVCELCIERNIKVLGDGYFYKNICR